MCDMYPGFSIVILVYARGEEREKDNCRYAILAPDKFIKKMSKSQINTLADHVFPELGWVFGPVALKEGTCYKMYSSQSIYEALWACANSNDWSLRPFMAIELEAMDDGDGSAFRATPIRPALFRQYLI